MSMGISCRAIGAGIVAVAGATGLVLGAGPGAAAPDTGSAGAGSADLALAISSAFDADGAQENSPVVLIEIPHP